MADEIKPALTPEEWAIGGKEHSSFRIIDGAPVRWDVCEWCAIDSDTAGEMVAIGNAALPNDSPYKITRGDVKAIKRAGHYGSNGAAVLTPERLDELLAIADKLAALLPPE